MMDTKVALLVIYNHRYDKNIPIIDELYKGKFTYVYHLVPFYDGDKPNVIPVYDSSYYFQNYVSQAYTHLKDKEFTHFFAVADDIIINPSINESNLWDKIGINTDDCYLPRKVILQQKNNNCGKKWWGVSHHAVAYTIKQKGVEVQNILPSYDEAEAKFKERGLPIGNIPLNVIKPNGISEYRIALKCLLKRGKINYPLLGGYVDIFLVPAEYMSKFCKYCGAFAATKLFVEIAIPTALVLSVNNIRYNEDVKLKEGDLWNEEQKTFLEKYGYKLNTLLKEYPQDLLFLHPIKLSKWKL